MDTNNRIRALHPFLCFKLALWSIVELLSGVYLLNKRQHLNNLMLSVVSLFAHIVKEYVERETIKSDFFQGPAIDAMRVGKRKTKIPRDIFVLNLNTLQRPKNRQYTSMKDTFHFRQS